MDADRAKLWKDRWLRAKEFYRPWHDQSRKELAFALKLKHYVADPGNAPDALGRVAFKGRELFSKIRRMVADVTAAPLYIECQPVNPADDDPRTAEDAKFALEHDVRNPDKGFDTFVERLVLGAIAARGWFMAVDYHAECGPYGEILFRTGPLSRLMWDPSVQDPWDPRCRWIIEEVPEMEVSEAKEAWKGFAKLNPDGPPPGESDDFSYSDEAGRVRRAASVEESSYKPDSGTAVILKCWSRHDGTRKKALPESEELPEHAQYMACTADGCGFKSDPQAGLPEWGGPCPECLDGSGDLNPLYRVTHETVDRELLAFKQGRRFEVIAPSQDLVGHDGSWPHDLRNWPYMVLTRYEHPLDPIGISETALDGNQQVILNALMQRSWQQAVTSPNILAIRGRLEAADGSDFQITDEPWLLAYWSQADGQNGRIEQFKADGIAASTVQVWNLIQNNFRADVGTGDVGVAPDQSKDIPVGTINALVESGSIPTDHLIRRLRSGLSRLFGVVHDLQRATWTVERWVRLTGAEGVESWKRMSGATLPTADVRVSADPMSKRMDVEDAKAIVQWYQLPPAIRRELAPKFGIAPSTVERIEQTEMQLQQQAMEMQAAAMPGGPMAAPPANAPPDAGGDALMAPAADPAAAMAY